MSVELNQQTFKRLVQLYLLSIALGIAAVVYEVVVWSGFSDDFDKITVQHFGEPTDTQMFVIGSFVLSCFLAHVVATFALLRFRPLARLVFWASLLLMLPAGFVPSLGFSWTGFWALSIETISGFLFGMVLLLAYSRNHGAVWFQRSDDQLKAAD